MAKYQKYAEYKDSGLKEIGQIPINWNISKIKFLTKCLDGQRIPLNGTERGEKQGDIPYWGANKVVDYLNDWIFDEELILLGEDGAPFFDKSKNVAFAVNGKIWPNNHVHVLRPFKKLVNTKFLTYALNCTDYSLYISGSTRDKLNQSDMDNILIRLPAIIEQDKIAAFLDHETAQIDTLIAKQEKLIELLKEKRQAVISHAVTKGLNPNIAMKDSGVEWLGEVPDHWIVTKFGFHTLKIGSGKTPKGGAEIYQDEGILFIRSQNVYNDGLRVESSESTYISEAIHDDMSTSKVYSGDILLNITGGSIGRSCLVPDEFPEANVNQHVCIIRVSKYLQEFLALVIQSDLIQAQIQSIQTGGNREGLNFEQISNFYFALPPTEEQKELVKYLEDKVLEFSKLEVKAHNAIQLMQERRTALISAAVTGKIDVRNWQNPNKNNEVNMELSA
ncbi:restriction endonuclease subunit S [Acinetobacter haemolyticus]|uniref:restriction endonuclease subunit S n=1 Tax=Acinetobacter haemolyticus TaxID=29430 RepID=UPI000D68E07E|nr:restriction endonuclease subunit S [Acinetobacter haemolyticus]